MCLQAHMSLHRRMILWSHRKDRPFLPLSGLVIVEQESVLGLEDVRCFGWCDGGEPLGEIYGSL